MGIHSGLKVRFTDYDDAPLRFVEQSAAEKRPSSPRTRYSTRQWLDWRDPLRPNGSRSSPRGRRYCETSTGWSPSVANLIGKLLAPGGLALIASPYRVAAEGFAETLGEPLGLDG